MISRVVALEDDSDVLAIYDELLGQEFDLKVARNLKSAFALLADENTHFDLVIADLFLPDGDLPEVAKQKEWCELLSRHRVLAISEIDDCALLQDCLSSWADDFLLKPFNNNAFVAKCRALVSRGRLHLDMKRMVLVFGARVSEELTANEFKLLAFLLDSCDCRFDANELLQSVWGGESGIQRLHTALSRLRVKLRPLGVEVAVKADGELVLYVPPLCFPD